MNNSKNPFELFQKVQLACATDLSTTKSLQDACTRLMDALSNVPEAAPLVAVGRKAYSQAHADDTASGMKRQLAELYVWLGAIKVGWL